MAKISDLFVWDSRRNDFKNASITDLKRILTDAHLASLTGETHFQKRSVELEIRHRHLVDYLESVDTESMEPMQADVVQRALEIIAPNRVPA